MPRQSKSASKKTIGCFVKNSYSRLIQKKAEACRMNHGRNCGKCDYKGTEPSPKGLGFCAHNMTEGYGMKGRDGRIWIVKSDRNGTQSWKRYTGICN